MKIQRYFNDDGAVESFEFDGWRVTVAQLANREWLQANAPRLKAIYTQVRADPQHFTPEDFTAAKDVIEGKYIGLTPEELQATFQGETIMDPRMQELNELRTSADYKNGRVLATTNSAKLNDANHRSERRALEREAELEASLKAEEPRRADRDYAGNPKSPGGLLKGNAKFIFPEVFKIEKLPAHEQVHAARSLRQQWLSDPTSAYRDEHHPDHKSAVESMALLYKAETMESGEPVITDDQ